MEIPSYRRAAERFEALTKVALSKNSLIRLVTAVGQAVVEAQAVEAEATVKPPAPGEAIVFRAMPEPDSAVMAVSFDGVLLNIRGEGWKEVKIATFSAVETVEAPAPAAAPSQAPEQKVRLTHHSYRAGLWEAKVFAQQQWAEGLRRGLEKAKTIVSVNDGAAWIWLIIAMCYAPCIEIVDWWHALEKLWAAANHCFGQGTPQARTWLAQLKDHLWAGKLRTLLADIRLVCPRSQPLAEPVWQLISYLFHHRRRMAYERFHQAGYPIGSGSVEAAAKVVVQARMKQAGMRWTRKGAQAMLALRCLLLSDRWPEVWSGTPPP